jgi:hypothetical protein
MPRLCRALGGGAVEEFKRLGIEGDFDKPYKTMDFHAEARIAGELLKIAKSGQLYRGSKPIMWSVVERTALAEAEVEYQPYESDTIWVKFPVVRSVQAGEEWRKNAELATCNFRRHLDHHALDHPRQPRHLIFVRMPTAFMRSRGGKRLRPASRARS